MVYILFLSPRSNGVPERPILQYAFLAAIVTLKKGAIASESEIVKFCKDRLASFKKPRSVDFVKAIPKTGPGKIDKKKLRDFYRGTREKQLR